MTNSQLQNLTWNGVLANTLGQHASVILTTGDRLEGTVQATGDDLLVLSCDNRTQFIRLACIAAIETTTADSFAPSETPTPHINSPKNSPKNSVDTLKENRRTVPQNRPLIRASMPIRVVKPTFEPTLTSQLTTIPEAARWNDTVRDADCELYIQLRTAYEERRRADLDVTKLNALADRHPASLDIQLLRGHSGFFLRKLTMATDALFRAAVLSRGKYWSEYASACLLDNDLEHALLAYQEFYLSHTVKHADHWANFLKLSVWISDFAGLGQILAAVQQRLWPDECEIVFAGLRGLDFASEALSESLDFAVWQNALQQLHSMGNTCLKPFEHKRDEFKAKIAKVEVENKFADIEEDITGIIGEAKDLIRNGRMTSAFTKLNEGYQLVPSHPRIKAAEAELRGPGQRINNSLDQVLFETSLSRIIQANDLLVLDTSVCSVPAHLNVQEAELDKALRDQGYPGLATLEEKVGYHTFLQRFIDNHPKNFFATDGVLDEVKSGLAKMKNRKASQSFGKSAEALRRSLCAASRNTEFTQHQLKKVRTTKATFNRLRSKGRLSEVDYDILCRTFVLAMDRKVALLSNDRGIHAGVADIINTHRAGNRNIAFLEPSNVEVYASIHKSHFEQVDLTKIRV